MSPPFIIFVAIDLSEGRVVRLTRGEMDQATVYGDDPVAVARGWQERGACWLHVVDLDAATKGEAYNAPVVSRILQEVQIPVQVAGGIRSREAIAGWLDRGAARICLGTRALDPDFLAMALGEFGDAILAAVDARSGRVQVAGWRRSSGETTLEVVGRLAEAGVARVLFTDIERDGTLLGPNLQATEEVLGTVQIPVIASGGVGGLEDLAALARLAPMGLEGAVVGKALYSGALSLEEALRVAAAPATRG